MMRLSDNRYVYVGSIPISIHERNDDRHCDRVDYLLHYFYDFSKSRKLEHSFVCSTCCDFVVHDEDGHGHTRRYDLVSHGPGVNTFRDFEDLIRRFDDNSIIFMDNDKCISSRD